MVEVVREVRGKEENGEKRRQAGRQAGCLEKDWETAVCVPTYQGKSLPT